MRAKIFYVKIVGRLGHVAVKCQYRKASPTVTNTLPSNPTLHPYECNNVQDAIGKVWQTVKFSKKKRAIGRENEAIQKSGTNINFPHGIPGKFSTQHTNTSNNSPSNQSVSRTKIYTNYNDLSTLNQVISRNKFTTLDNPSMELDAKEFPNSKINLDLRVNDVAPQNNSKDNVSCMKETSLSNMQKFKSSTDNNNEANSSKSTNLQSGKDLLISRINYPNIINNIDNENIYCMEEDGIPQHVSHKTISVAQLANKDQYVPNPTTTPNPFKILSPTSNQSMKIDSIITNLSNFTTQTPSPPTNLTTGVNIDYHSGNNYAKNIYFSKEKIPTSANSKTLTSPHNGQSTTKLEQSTRK